MAKRIAKFNKIALSIASALFILFPFIGVSGGVKAAAETEGTDSAIMRELGGLTIGGEKFDATDYPADQEGTPALLNLNELGYGYTAEKQVAYSLILYIYNPAQLNIQEDLRNAVQMRIGNAERFGKYALNVIESSSDKLFYKLGVSFTDTEKSAALAALNKDSRVYEVSSLEFYLEGFNATSFDISPTRVFTYTGYAAGLGDGAESTLTHTLSYTVKGGTETIPLSVEHTSWRPEGTNGNSPYTQDTIHSVYFAVPKEIDEKYDYVKSVHAWWTRARTAPIFVTGDLEAYEALKDLQKKNSMIVVDDGNLSTGADPGVDGMKHNAPEQFALSGDGWAYDWMIGTKIFGNGAQNQFRNVFGFDNNHMVRDKWSIDVLYKQNTLPTLYLTAYTGGTDASAFVLTSSELTKLIQRETLNGYFSNDKKVAEKYPSYLFENYDENKTDRIIEFDEKLTLHSERVRQSFWEKFIGEQHSESIKNYTEEALKEITESDIAGEHYEVSERLLISLQDTENFINFYNDNCAENTIYLLRFAVSEYEVETTLIYKLNKYNGVWAYDERNRNGYLAQTECYLDFDIIDFEYVKDDETFVIPVSMSPIDIFPELTPPPKYDDDFWPYGLAIMGGLIAFYVVYKISCKVARG